MKDSRLSVVVIDDDSVSLEVACSILDNSGFNCLPFNCAETFLSRDSEDKPDLMLIDIYMPGLDGISLCRKIREDDSWNDVPVLIMTSSDNDVGNAFESGANDYIEKPFDPSKHIPRVEFHIAAARNSKALLMANEKLSEWSKTLEFKVEQRTKEIALKNAQLRDEINERRFLEDRLRYIATHDFLTRVFNRSKLEQHLDEIILSNDKNAELTTFLFYMDLDQFKIINEHFGHFAGDELLRQISEQLLGFAQPESLVARVGGDEFAIVFNAESKDKAYKKVLRLADQINNYEFKWQDQSFYFSASGAMLCFTDKWLSSGHMLSMADTMIFDIKLKGGNLIEVYDSLEGTSDEKRLELSWIPQINKAVKDNDFQLHFQEIVPSNLTGKKKAEILLRMKASAGSEKVLPSYFIGVAEKFHLIKKIDSWVVEETCKYLANHECQFEKLCVNLSGESVSNRKFLKDLIARMKNYGLDGSQLCFEVTETSALHDLSSTRNFIDYLKTNTQCKIALDDFGTGQASYAYLKSVPFDILKIDGVFVKEITKQSVDKKMVASLIDIAHELNMSVVAECVETKELRDMLISMEADWLQGFYLHKPEPLSLLMETVEQ
ncbi:EAL domain-containing protein [Aliikangiella sp. G2MR2-5]|uniref:two-component system response regulator n=1 Tax=Aliikangiella sp. G2MR2-5 TaxID=2788943 RepID=UPI0018AAB152|nr:EAL domain-containing protein [Aliikangiella sp. G2MR2-5]